MNRRNNRVHSELGFTSYAQLAELAFWAVVKDSKDPSVIQSYLEAFPEGTFTPLARAMIAKLKAGRNDEAA